MEGVRDAYRIARTLEGTIEAPHFDQIAFKVVRIYATLAADELTANPKLAPDEQALKCLVAAETFSPDPTPGDNRAGPRSRWGRSKGIYR